MPYSLYGAAGLKNTETYEKFEITLAEALSKEKIDVICPATIRMACEDFVNYLKCVWNIELEEAFWPRFEEAFASAEFNLFLKNWISEWTCQWRKRVKVVADQKDVPTKPNNKPAPPLPQSLFDELKWAATLALINHKLICGTVKIAEAVVKQTTIEVKQGKKSDKEWAVALLTEVCRNARTLAQTTGVLLWVVLPQKPAQR
jgi:hypothetical protein